ncbi:MAG: DUF4276 family protein [Myxococcales bacterium]|jgi:hypothetical protein|nr:DUF4276 family protein [Myxococcales bacterium]
MSRLIFLLEEFSMKVLLDDLLPRFFPELQFLCVSHEGKQDLEKSIPRKLRQWKEPGARFVVIRDSDGGDCRALKGKLVGLCHEGLRKDTLVRIACHELEAWYLGDVDALAEAFEDERLRDLKGKERFRDPDKVVHPARALEEMIPEFQKVSGARRMAVRMRRTGSTSSSFQIFIDSVERAASALELTALAEGN